MSKTAQTEGTDTHLSCHNFQVIRRATVPVIKRQISISSLSLISMVPDMRMVKDRHYFAKPEKDQLFITKIDLILKVT